MEEAYLDLNRQPSGSTSLPSLHGEMEELLPQGVLKLNKIIHVKHLALAVGSVVYSLFITTITVNLLLLYSMHVHICSSRQSLTVQNRLT